MPKSRTTMLSKKSNTPLEVLWASLIRPKSESYEGGGAVIIYLFLIIKFFFKIINLQDLKAI